MLNRKNVFFVPMAQDDPESKPHSLVASFSLLTPTLDAAFQGKQYQKIFIQYDFFRKELKKALFFLKNFNFENEKKRGKWVVLRENERLHIGKLIF